MKLSDILAKKRKEDMIGLRNAQKNGTMKEYLRDDLVAAGIDPEQLTFGGNPQLAVGSATTITKNLKGGLSMLATHQTASGALTNVPVEKFLEADIATINVPKCPSCHKPVYKQEETLFENIPWHHDCFRCGLLESKGCKRILRKGEFETHSNIAYCNACFHQLFQIGAARGTVLSTEELSHVHLPPTLNTAEKLASVSSTLEAGLAAEPRMSITERIKALNAKTDRNSS